MIHTPSRSAVFAHSKRWGSSSQPNPELDTNVRVNSQNLSFRVTLLPHLWFSSRLQRTTSRPHSLNLLHKIGKSSPAMNIERWWIAARKTSHHRSEMKRTSTIKFSYSESQFCMIPIAAGSSVVYVVGICVQHRQISKDVDKSVQN